MAISLLIAAGVWMLIWAGIGGLVGYLLGHQRALERLQTTANSAQISDNGRFKLNIKEIPPARVTVMDDDYWDKVNRTYAENLANAEADRLYPIPEKPEEYGEQ